MVLIQNKQGIDEIIMLQQAGSDIAVITSWYSSQTQERREEPYCN